MNKTKKLLSVLLAVLMILSSMTVMASAAKTNYKTVAELEALDAYSPYGQVTRLNTEERMSITLDFLDNILGQANINPGKLFDLLGLSLTVDLRSVNAILGTVDNVQDLLGNFFVSILSGLLGIIGELNFDNWQTGMTREGTAQLTIIRELLELLKDNKDTLSNVISSGEVDLGSIIGGLVDLSSIEKLLGDLPGLIKGLVFGLFERWDDTTAEIATLEAAKVGNGNVESTVNTFVKSLFTNDMRISTVKLDAAGNITSKHDLPDGTSGYRVLYNKTTVDGDIILTATSYATQKYVDAELKADPDSTIKVGDYYVSAKYVLDKEVGTEDYVWHQVNFEENEDGELVLKTLEDGSYDFVGGATPNLKYYELGSPLIPALDAATVNSKIDLSSADISAGDLLYTFIPYLFEDLATVVINGSVKKILAEFFGAKFNHIGTAGPEGDDDIKALGTDDIFVGEQGDYVFEWSDYYVAADGTHYYRFLDDLYKADLSNTNNYFDIIDWEYNIDKDFMDRFVPADDSSVNSRLLLNLNDFLVAVAETITVASKTTVNKADGKTAEWVRPTFAAGNANIVANIKAAAQAVIKLAPQHIFGSNYTTNEHCYYDMLVSTENDTVLAGIAAQLVDILMPSMTLPTAEELMKANVKVGAILAAVIREFAAQLVPEYNYDALIYADFGTTSSDKVKTFLSDKDSNYWLDVILTMGVDIGFEYLRAFADMGEGSDLWNSFVAYSGYGVDGKTYAAGTSAETLRNQWEGMLDYVIDWALFDGWVTETVTEVIPGDTSDCDTSNDADQTVTSEKTYCKYEWTWKMENLVEVDGLTIDLATAQDPWAKLDKILFGIIPFDEILTITTTTEYPTKLEKFLRYDLILGLVDLRWDALINTVQFNGTNKYFRTGNVLDQLAKLIKNIVNGLFDKVGGGSYALLPSAMTDLDTLANQANIGTLVNGLLGALYVAAQDPDGSKGGLLDTVLPIVGFFLGWKTDPQVLADPVIGYSFRDGNDYAFQWSGQTNYPAIDAESTKITFLNNSSGMLEKHRDTSTVDHEYAIQIKSVTSDATTNTLTFDYGDGYVSPYETLEIKIGGTYNGEEAATITIAYDFLGKDGTAVGGTQYVTTTVLFSNQYEDSNVDGRFEGDDDEDYSGIDQYKKFVFTEDIYKTVTEYCPRIFYVEPTVALSKPAKSFEYISAPNGNIDMTGNAATYFDYITDQDEAGWLDSINKDDPTETRGYLYKAASGVTAETFSEENSIANNLYGVYDMGQVAVKYGSGEKTWNIDFIYYNDFGLAELYEDNKNNNYHANMGVDAAIYNEYNEAWKTIVYGAKYPMMTSANNNATTDYVTAIQPHIPAAIERFEKAKEAMVEAIADAGAVGAAASLPKYVESLYNFLKTDDKPINGFEVNFQDYEYYEYFAYADLRTAARNLYASYLAPEIMDTYYIQGSGIREEELLKVIDYVAENDSATKSAAIDASKLENDAEAIAASVEAKNNWQAPIHTKLYVDDMTARLNYYKGFLTGHEEAADHKKFLELEIAHVKAQGFVESDYEAVSWARYAKALAAAEAVVAGTDEYADFNSRIFDVKWELMVARKQLLKKADSLIEAGGTAAIKENAAKAEAIFASFDANDGAWKVVEGVEYDAAIAQLITALGYNYQAIYTSNDLEVKEGKKQVGDLKTNKDGTPMMFNMYADSAYEYIENDRPNNSGNQAKVNAANANLVAALANFEAAAADPELIVTELGNGISIIDRDLGVSSGEFKGLLYGVDTINGESLEDYFTTEAGSIEIIENENGVLSTGATVNLLDDDGNVVETYIFVYFGDVNGDEVVDITDAGAVELHDAWEEMLEEDSAFYYSAEVNYDGFVDITDAGAIELHDAWEEMLPEQEEIAAGIDAAY